MGKKLVAYFSASGVTEKVARNLAQAADADLYEIRPKEPYTKADLDWTDKKSRSTLEMSDEASRPALSDQDAEIEKYQTIYLGFPVWWHTAPSVIFTFLESYDFSGRTIVVFATSGGGDYGNIKERIQASVGADTQIIEGGNLNGDPSLQKLAGWLADK